MQEQKDNISQLRKRLQDCEDYILRIAKSFKGYWDKATEDVIDDHLGTRQWILNEMFAKHATDAEVRRFEVVNERLLALTKQLNERHRTLQDQMSAIHTLGGEPFELETTLLYSHNDEDPQLFAMEEDAFYGSRWNEMLWVVRRDKNIPASMNQAAPTATSRGNHSSTPAGSNIGTTAMASAGAKGFRRRKSNSISATATSVPTAIGRPQRLLSR